VQTVPRDDDSTLPPSAEPAGCLQALLLALYEDSINSICLSGGLSSFVSAIEPQQIRIPHDCVVPGLFNSGDIEDLIAQAADHTPVRVEGFVNGSNIPLSPNEIGEYEKRIRPLLSASTQDRLAVSHRFAAVEWFTEKTPD
jgi:hypothetical protein